MAREFARHHRMVEVVKHQLASHIQRDFPVSDYGLIAVSSVILSADLGHAKVFVSCFGKRTLDQQALVDVLTAHSGRFRRAMAKVLHARSVPKLRFVYDDSTDRAERVAALLSQGAHKSDPPTQ